MAKKAGVFLKELAQLAGIPTDQKHWDAIVAIDTELPDEIATDLSSRLFTLDAAKHNSDLKKHFTALTLNGVDSALEALMDENEIADDIRTELKKETSSFKRIPALVAKIKELTEKKASAKSGDKKALQDEIDKLNKQVVDAKSNLDKALQAEREKAAGDILNYAISAELGSRNYALDVPKNVNVSTAFGLLNEELKAKKIKVVRQDDNTLKLVQSDNPDLEYREANKPVNFGDFVDKLLGTHKLLKVTEAPKPKTTSPKFTATDTPEVNQSLVHALDGNIAELEAQLAA